MNFHMYETAVGSARGLISVLLQQVNEEPDRIYNLAFSGGDTYALLFDIWGSEFMDQTPWNRMRFFWVDECCVPFFHSDSNYGTMYRLLLRYIPGFEGLCFPIDGTLSPEEEACRYADVVKKMVPAGLDEVPQFDAVCLAAESDGSLSFIHSGEEYLLTSSQWYVATVHPWMGQARVAMSGQLLRVARRIYFFMPGHEFQPVVHDIIQSGDTGPAVYVAHHGQEVELFFDQWAGAGELCMTKLFH